MSANGTRWREMPALTLGLPEELLQEIASRVARILDEEQPPKGEGWLRGAERIADYIDAPSSRVYALVSAGRIPVEHDGSALIASRSELDAWIRDGGGRRP